MDFFAWSTRRHALIPALPPAWATCGEVTGLGARDGFIVDMQWLAGEITSVAIHSIGGTRTTLKFGPHGRSVSLQPGETLTITPGTH
jgi:alpha-L-fucosidase 2